MELIDKQLQALEALDVPETKRADFDEFWAETMGAVNETPLEAHWEVVEHPIRSMEVRDLTYRALDGTPVRGWVLLPAGVRRQPVPAVVCYHGASGSRGFPTEFAPWVAMGAAVVTHDVRMQGGMTGSNTGFPCGAGAPSWATLGLADKRAWYYYHAWTDALRAFRLAAETPEIDAARIAVNGGSQGGALSLAVAALQPSAALCMADVPSSCWLEKRLFDRAGGYGSVAEFLRRHPDMLEQVCTTFSYYDNINLAGRIRCPVLVSVGLKDPVCPPENVYAACNKVRAPKEIVPYPFGEHDGGGAVHFERKLAFFRRHIFGD
jgi:cephalosporin-C deacetylase